MRIDSACGGVSSGIFTAERRHWCKGSIGDRRSFRTGAHTIGGNFHAADRDEEREGPKARWAAPLPRSAIELCNTGAYGAGRKKLLWQSHVIDLAKMEHATPEYQSINPNGLVPTLIHDGRTYIESIDIIQYLDGLAAMPPLSPVVPKEQADCRSLTALADGAQVALKP